MKIAELLHFKNLPIHGIKKAESSKTFIEFISHECIYLLCSLRDGHTYRAHICTYMHIGVTDKEFQETKYVCAVYAWPAQLV